MKISENPHDPAESDANDADDALLGDCWAPDAPAPRGGVFLWPAQKDLTAAE